MFFYIPLLQSQEICVIPEATENTKRMSLDTKMIFILFVVQESPAWCHGPKRKLFKQWVDTDNFCPHLDFFWHDTEPGNRGACHLSHCQRSDVQVQFST